MSVETWLAFLAASVVVLAIPGPTILLVVSYALGRGMRIAAPVAAGVVLGDLTAMTLSVLGVGALLQASAALFAVVKWAGAAYLIWMGAQLWRAGGAALEARAETVAPASGAMLRHAWLVTALNPKSILFFVAFVPHFLDPARPLAGQALILILSFAAMAGLNALLYAGLASRARRLFRSARAMARLNRLGGGALIAAGVGSLAMERPA